jgi:translation elongation factor EF-1alpha
MAKAAWCSATPGGGSGNGTVNIGGTVHTGRLQRSTTVTFTAAGAGSEEVDTIQEAKAEFVTLNGVSVGKEGGNVTVTGKSNSAKLTLSKGDGAMISVLPASYSAGGASTVNGAAISGDPGATAEYDFSVTLSAAANATVSDRTVTLVATANGGQQAQATISQAAGDATLSVTPLSVTIPASGSAVSVTVTSNTNWTVA